MGEGNKPDGGVGAWDRKTYARNRRRDLDQFLVHRAWMGDWPCGIGLWLQSANLGRPICLPAILRADIGHETIPEIN